LRWNNASLLSNGDAFRRGWPILSRRVRKGGSFLSRADPVIAAQQDSVIAAQRESAGANCKHEKRSSIRGVFDEESLRSDRKVDADKKSKKKLKMYVCEGFAPVQNFSTLTIFAPLPTITPTQKYFSNASGFGEVALCRAGPCAAAADARK
jgi:hypothetical protein